MYFPVAGVELNPLIPVLVGTAVALVLNQVGLTGGIATLPFMMSGLGFTTPSVVSTNLIFILISPLGSLYSYWRERRMLWRLGFLAGAGGILGSLFGPLILVGTLNDALRFKTVFGILLAFIGLELFLKRPRDIKVGKVERSEGSRFKHSFLFSGTTYTYPTFHVFIAGTAAGALSTTLGIGTGFLLIPFYTTVLGLPLYAVASSALLSTLVISAAGTIAYSFLKLGVSTAPDVRLGLLLGLGGIIGGFASAAIQRRMSLQTLNKVLGAVLLLWSIAYLRHGF